MISGDAMQVFCRIRPSSAIEGKPGDDEPKGYGTTSSDSCIEAWTSTGKISYFQGTRREFQLSGIYGPDITQEEVFDGTVASVVDGFVHGFNGTVLCAGRRGSGKSHTLIGSGPAGGAQQGMLARSMTRLFAGIETIRGRRVSVRISFVGIYCETLQDLLDPSSQREVVIRETSSGVTFLEGLSSRSVHSSVEATTILEGAHANKRSSRSHAIAIVYLEQRHEKETQNKDAAGLIVTQSCLMLVDLAASESSKRTDARFKQLEECKFINLSLSALGNCVAALAKRQAHIPYRDSKLTRLLTQSLGGNSKTALIVGLLPERDEMGETLASLILAQRAMSVMMDARINIVPDLDARCQDLQKQLDDQSDRLAQTILAKAAVEEGLEVAQDQLAQVHEEKHATDIRLQAMVDAFNRMAKERPSEDATSATIDRECKEKTECFRDSISSLKKGFEERIKAYKTAAARAEERCSSGEYELTKEKEAHLRTARDLRVCQSTARKQERETNHRISDLLKDLSDKDVVIEDLEARIRELETGARKHEDLMGREFVSRHQVEEMRSLFETAVEGLSNRLRDMEKRDAENIRKGIHGPGRRRAQARAGTFC